MYKLFVLQSMLPVNGVPFELSFQVCHFFIWQVLELKKQEFFLEHFNKCMSSFLSIMQLSLSLSRVYVFYVQTTLCKYLQFTILRVRIELNCTHMNNPEILLIYKCSINHVNLLVWINSHKKILITYISKFILTLLKFGQVILTLARAVTPFCILR